MLLLRLAARGPVVFFLVPADVRLVRRFLGNRRVFRTRR